MVIMDEITKISDNLCDSSRAIAKSFERIAKREIIKKELNDWPVEVIKPKNVTMIT